LNGGPSQGLKGSAHLRVQIHGSNHIYVCAPPTVTFNKTNAHLISTSSTVSIMSLKKPAGLHEAALNCINYQISSIIEASPVKAIIDIRVTGPHWSIDKIATPSSTRKKNSISEFAAKIRSLLIRYLSVQLLPSFSCESLDPNIVMQHSFRKRLFGRTQLVQCFIPI